MEVRLRGSIGGDLIAWVSLRCERLSSCSEGVSICFPEGIFAPWDMSSSISSQSTCQTVLACESAYS